MPAFKPGDKKPEGSGIKKGGLHKKTVIRRELAEEFEAKGFSPAERLADAMLSRDFELAKVLLDILPYLYAKRAPKMDGAVAAVVEEPLTQDQLKGLVQIARGK